MSRIDSKKLAALREAGFMVGPRDRERNKAFSGCYMVAEPQNDDGITIPTFSAGEDGRWCVVGDDLGQLVEDSFNAWFG